MTRATTVLPFMTLWVAGLACSSTSPSPVTNNSGGSAGQMGGSMAGGASGSTFGGAAGQGGSTSGGMAGIGGNLPTGSGGTAGQAGSVGGGGMLGVGGAAGSSGGVGASGGMAGSGTAGTGAAGAGGSGGTDAVTSDGCGQARTLQNGTINIDFDGGSRRYILFVPDTYDNTHPYRLVFAFAESGASADSVADRDYFRLAALDEDDTTIFVAPDAANGAGSWSQSDVELTDAILAELEADLCIDKTRLFSTGFSFGGAMSLALGCMRADVFRGIAFFSGADLTGSCTGTLTTPIAYYASQASGDSSGDPIPSSGRIKQAQFAEVNGCTPEPDATTFPAPGQPHRCTEYQNCTPGYPTKYCVFDGPHGWEPTDPGENTSWNAPEAWAFITQF